MVGHRCRSKGTAKEYAARLRKKGFKASVYKRGTGYGVSVRRK